MSDLVIGMVLWVIALSYPIICAKNADRAERKYQKEVEGWE